MKPSKLRYGSPEEVGLDPVLGARIGADVASGTRSAHTLPPYPGAVILAAKDGVIFEHEAFGYALLYADSRPTLLTADGRIPAQRDTIFDLASLSKLFTSIAAMQLVERGMLDLHTPAANYLPEFVGKGKENVTPHHLLTHTSGLPTLIHLDELPGREARMEAVYRAELVDEAGMRYRYGDLNMILLGWIVEEISGLPLDKFVASNITNPLSMTDTGYNPPASKLDRIAATEYKPEEGRGMVRGNVHDENAYALGGVAGHAGVFSTAYDLAILAQTILNGGSYGGARILQEETIRSMLDNHNRRFSGCDHGLGFELNQEWYMNGMASPQTAGHTGFTGTSLIIALHNRSFAILLTNRVHPTRNGECINPYRRALSRALAPNGR